MWAEIRVSDNFNVLLGNLFLPRIVMLKAIRYYFHFLKQNLNTYPCRVILLGNFSVPNCDWYNGISLYSS
jgi:hypothetical protein